MSGIIALTAILVVPLSPRAVKQVTVLFRAKRTTKTAPSLCHTLSPQVEAVRAQWLVMQDRDRQVFLVITLFMVQVLVLVLARQ
ncbi:MAG: hypothetical protein DLM72_06185 [Candidatus Nitrosopolaris wilkensis]|nr:MAG: hypothetical protein DLM72_06185 [Candidatus Nitrosopolaris wilkensis]